MAMAVVVIWKMQAQFSRADFEDRKPASCSP